MKYETPEGARMVLDVPPWARPGLGDQAVPLVITEGVKKADAAVSQGLCCIALLGVWNWRGTNEAGGKTALPDWESVALNKRPVYVAFDSDVMQKREVAAALERLAAFLASRDADVRLVYFPSDPGASKVGLDDYFAAGHTAEELLGLGTRERRPPRGISVHGSAALPPIAINDRPLRSTTDDAVGALVAQNAPPTIFVRDGKLVRVRGDECGRPVIESMTESVLRGRLARVADFVRAGSKGDRHVAPPLDTVRDVAALGAWPFPPLQGVIEIPALRSDGTVLDLPGYDAATRLLYVPASDLSLPPVPPTPSRNEIANARTLILDDLLTDFPFADDASRANALALLLTPVLRPAIAGKIPLCLLNKPQAGTGASLCAEIVSIIATGRSAGMLTAPRDDDEWRKRITALLLSGATVITIDNVTATLTSASLAAALTSTIWEDRRLGLSEVVRLPQRATWIVTGNNVALGGDLARRAYEVRLDANVARPWERRDFRHPKLLGWVQNNRGKLLAALLTLSRGWYAAGCPRVTTPAIGSFDAWAETVGNVLAFAGVENFLRNRERLHEQIDEDATSWEALVTVWHATYGEAAVTVAKLVAATLESDGPLREALPSDLAAALKGEGDFARRLGKALAARVDRVYGRLRLERAGTDSHKRVALWRVRGLRDSAGFSPPICEQIEEVSRSEVGQQGPREALPPKPQNPQGPFAEDVSASTRNSNARKAVARTGL